MTPSHIGIANKYKQWLYIKLNIINIDFACNCLNILDLLTVHTVFCHLHARMRVCIGKLDFSYLALLECLLTWPVLLPRSKNCFELTRVLRVTPLGSKACTFFVLVNLTALDLALNCINLLALKHCVVCRGMNENARRLNWIRNVH
jgi:hypothetical protein